MRMYNVHTHIFNFKCVPTGFLTNYLPSYLVRVLAPLLRIGPIAWVLSSVMRLVPVDMVKKYRAFLHTGIRNTPQRVFEELLSAYPDDNTGFVVLPMNFDYMGGGHAPANYKTQLELVADVKRKYPNKCYPFISIDPRMGNADDIKKFVADFFIPFKGFHGIKLYPSLGFYPCDERLEEMYAFAERNEIPVLTHCTRTGAFYAGRKVPEDLLRFRSFNPTQVTSNRQNQKFYQELFGHPPKIACDAFLDPVHFYDVLKRFPKLKLCFAHYGGLDEMQKFLRNPDADQGDVKDGYTEETSWYYIVRDLMSKFENVYTDISYTLCDTNEKVVNRLLDDMRNGFNNRILFGTDFFMTLQKKDEKSLYEDFRNAIQRSQDGVGLWNDMIYRNAKDFLSSTFYQVP